MANRLWKPVPAPAIQFARAAHTRGLSLRSIAAELAAAGWRSSSGGVYLPGSISRMLRDVDAHNVPPLQDVIIDSHVEHTQIDVDAGDLEQPATIAVDTAPDVDAAAPVVDSAPPSFRDLLMRLRNLEDAQVDHAMAVAGLRTDQMGVLETRPDLISVVANALDANGWTSRLNIGAATTCG